jgi:phenylacetate-CoA ligase
MMPRTTSARPWEPVSSAINQWTSFSRLGEIWWTRSAGIDAILAARRNRFNALVRFAREQSPYYRHACRGLPAGPLDPRELPVMVKHDLMAHFDDWVTDPEVSLAGVTAFVKDREHIGERYLGRYVVWKSSGSTGEPGIFVQDGESLATFDALMAVHMDPVRFAARHSWELVSGGGRAALVAATGEHFASIASWQRVCQSSPWVTARGFSILDPLPRLVSELNDYQPVFLASYPTMLAMLAEEQQARRLRIKPARLWSGGERLAPEAAGAIQRAFGAPLANEYGASECMSIAYGCREGWLHVNADWVLLEPVESDFTPTPAGEASHTVLLTNLANRVQPVIRYDLGDSVVARHGRCKCGNPLPAIRVEGRRDDVLTMRAPDGALVRLLPLALTTVVEESADVHRFQIVQTAEDRLALRLELHGDQDRRAAFRTASAALRDYLAQQSLPNVRVALDKLGPLTDRHSGKLRAVVSGIAGKDRAHRPR